MKKRVFVLMFVLAAGFSAVFLLNAFVIPPEKILSNLKFFQAGLTAVISDSETAPEEQDYEEGITEEQEILEEPVVVVSAENSEPKQGSRAELHYPAKPLTQEEIQEQLDDIAEKIDVVERQTADLISSLTLNPESKALNPEKIQESEDQNPEPEEEILLAAQPIIENKPQIMGSPGKPNYPKILISEVQVAGADDSKQEFVELHNPNNQDIELTSWYLQRKTAAGLNWSTFASKNLFNGKSISGNGYFLIARIDYYLGSADIFTNSSITEDNSFALKNPNGEISDKLGFGNAQDPELLASITPGNGQSVGRKLFDDGSERDTDNNFYDFELQNPTPRMRNTAYVPPVEPPAPVLENILINEIQIEGETAKNDWVELYNPNDIDVDISAYKLRKRTSEGGESSIRVFPAGSIIFAKGYYLWASSANEEFPSSVGANTWTKQNIAENNSIVLLTSNDIVLSALAWGVSENPFVEGVAFSDNPIANQSLGRIWSEEAGEYKNTGDNSADFELQTPTPKEKNIAWVEPPPAPQDTTPPEVIFMLDAVQNSLNFTINFEITDPLDVVTPSGLASYIFHWKEGEDDWQQDSEQEIVGLPMSYNSGREFLGQNGKTYFFQISARDLLDNNSGWLPNPPALTTVSASDLPVLAPIVINEIQVAPIEQRFIELYNLNDVEINLTGWYLQRKTKSAEAWASLISSSNFEGKAIPANGYFLISRELADSDILLSITLSDDNSLALKNSDREIVDKVGWGEAQDFETAAAQNPLAGQSITRIAGADTNDNSQDFVISDAPMPGGE